MLVLRSGLWNAIEAAAPGTLPAHKTACIAPGLIAMVLCIIITGAPIHKCCLRVIAGHQL